MTTPDENNINGDPQQQHPADRAAQAVADLRERAAAGDELAAETLAGMTPMSRAEFAEAHDDGMPRWHLHVRLQLIDGTAMVRNLGTLPFEPHLGDVMDMAGFQVTADVSQADRNGVLRFQPDGDGLFFTPAKNVLGIHIDVYGPDEQEISSTELKPGRNAAGLALRGQQPPVAGHSPGE